MSVRPWEDKEKIEFLKLFWHCIESIEIEQCWIDSWTYAIVKYINLRNFGKLINRKKNGYYDEWGVSVDFQENHARIYLDDLDWKYPVDLEHIVQIFASKDKLEVLLR